MSTAKNSKPKRNLEKKLELFVFFLVTALIAVILWPFCTTIVQAGHVGVYYSKFFGGTVTRRHWDEGLRLFFPWDAIIQYDARMQSKEYSVIALTLGGLSVRVDMSVIWYIHKEEAGFLHASMGLDYATKIIDPAVVSAVRSVIGSYEQSLLYDGNPLHLQNDVKKLLDETFVDAPFYFHAILISEVRLPDEMNEAISEKFVAEQNVLAQRYRVLESIEKYRRSFVDAEAVRIMQSTISEGMSEGFLRYLGIQATLELAQSSNAKLVIMGDKDGLPLILNPETLDASASLPAGLARDEYIQTEGERLQNLVDSYNAMQVILNRMSDILGEFMNDFPVATESFHDAYTIPQVNKVPTTDREDD